MIRFSTSRVVQVLVISILILIIFFNFQDLKSGEKFSELVPNIVHFVLLKENTTELDFISATCILAAFLNQNPQKVVLHTNAQHFHGKYWNITSTILGSKLHKSSVSRPTHVFGSPLSSIFHASDVIRIKVLQEEGGIFLDLDTFLVRPLDEFFKYDVTLGWPKDQNIGTQIILAKPQAKFINLWLQSYKDYRASMWYYNAGEAPTQVILKKNPSLVHRVTEAFGVQGLSRELYQLEHWDQWKEYFAIHLLARHRDYLVPDDPIVEFNEVNIQNYSKTFGQLARSIWNHKEVIKFWN